MNIPLAWMHRTKTNRRILLVWGVFPCLLAVIVLVVFDCLQIDLLVARSFYDDEHNEWRGNRLWVCQFLYNWGPVPGMAMGIAGASFAMISLVLRRDVTIRWIGLYLLTVYLVGPGLLVNGIFKPCFQRPRPRELREFGGQSQFVPPGGFGEAGHNSSFPSGHASSAFYLMTPGLLYIGSRRVLVRNTWLIAGLFWGTLVGLARIAVGAHFVSDVLWSGAIVYAVSLATALSIRPKIRPDCDCQ